MQATFSKETIFTKKAGADGIERIALIDDARNELRNRLKTISDIEIRNRFGVSKNLLQKYYLYPGDCPITEKGKKAAIAILCQEEAPQILSVESPTQKALMDLVHMLKSNGIKEVTLRF